MALLDGKKVADELIEDVKIRAQSLRPTLAVILVGENPASLSYVRQKKLGCERARIGYVEYHYSENVSQQKILEKIEEINRDPTINGVIVQLPLPKQLFPALIIRAIDPKKDVDGFHAYNLGKMFLSAQFEDLPPATPAGIVLLLEHYKIPIEGQEVVVVGHSNIVGKPISTMLLNRNATVTTCHVYTKNLAEHTKKADLLIVAVGKANLITVEMVKDGVVVVDVGINKMADGTLRGDVDFEAVSKKASFISPVPGGVGPMTVASLLLNTVRAAERQKQIKNYELRITN